MSKKSRQFRWSTPSRGVNKTVRFAKKHKNASKNHVHVILVRSCYLALFKRDKQQLKLLRVLGRLLMALQTAGCVRWWLRKECSWCSNVNVTSLGFHTRSQSPSQLINIVVDDAFWYSWPRANETLLQLDCVSDEFLVVVHTLLHQSPNFVVIRVKIWTVGRLHIWRDKFRRFLLEELDFFTCAMWNALSCWKTNVSHFPRCIIEAN